MGLNGSFFLNCQSTIMIDDFTAGERRHAGRPRDAAPRPFPPPTRNSTGVSVPVTGRAGSVMLMTGLLWHRPGGDRTDTPRIGVLGQYLAKFVRPMEDQLRGVRQEVIERASPTLRALLGIDYPYPQVLDTSRR